MLQKYSWYINSLQNVIIWSQEEKGLIALKLQYLFSFFPNPVTARLPPTALATFSLPSICTLWRVQFSNSILCTTAHIFIYSPFFSTKWTWKQEVPLCFPDVSQQGKKRPPRWSVTGLLWWCQGHNLDFCRPWLCKFYLGCLPTSPHL